MSVLMSIVLLAIVVFMVIKHAAQKGGKGSDEWSSKGVGKRKRAHQGLVRMRSKKKEKKELRKQTGGNLRPRRSRKHGKLLCQKVVRGKEVKVNHDITASYLHYNRPAARNVQYPKAGYPSPSEVEIAQAIYESLDEFKVGRKFQLGKLKPEYKLMTKVIHYNISPRGSEKQLKRSYDEFLHVMMNWAIIVDIAQIIWNEMVEFKQYSIIRANLPFVAMVTSLCASVGVPFWTEKISKPPIGQITLVSVKKSKAMNRGRVANPTPIPEASTATTWPKPKKNSWKSKMLNFTKKIIGKQNKLERQMAFYIQVAEQQFGTKYVEVESEEEEESDEEEEVEESVEEEEEESD